MGKFIIEKKWKSMKPNISSEISFPSQGGKSKGGERGWGVQSFFPELCVPTSIIQRGPGDCFCTPTHNEHPRNVMFYISIWYFSNYIRPRERKRNSSHQETASRVPFKNISMLTAFYWLSYLQYGSNMEPDLPTGNCYHSDLKEGSGQR